MAEKSDGTLWSWGADWDGELAYTASQTCVYNGANNPCSMTPAQVPGLSGLSQLAGADWHSLALKNDGTVWAWGGNWQGELGDGTTTGSTTPVQATGLTGQTLIAVGREHSLSAIADRVATTTYTYDKLYRLTGVASPEGTTSYSYDPLGNRTSKVLGSGTTNYSYDRADRITAAGSTNYTVNAAGNETGRGTDTFTYDQANRLKSTTVAGATASYTYDGDGKRFSKTVGGTTTNYMYDVGGGLPALLDDGTNKYVWGAGKLAYAVNKSSGGIGVYHTDDLGSVRAITDSNGVVQQTYQTDEFGIPTLTQAANGQPFGYTGEQRDPEDGLVYLRARVYDPGTGRFAQQDQLRLTAPGIAGWNRFAYVGGNPTSNSDPSGFAAKAHILRPEQTYKGPECENFEQVPDAGPALDAACNIAEVAEPYAENVGENITQATEAASDVSTQTVVTFGHGARHFIQYGQDFIDEAESAIVQSVRTSVSTATAVGTDFWGKVTVRGQDIIYRAKNLVDRINIGTYTDNK